MALRPQTEAGEIAEVTGPSVRAFATSSTAKTLNASLYRNRTRVGGFGADGREAAAAGTARNLTPVGRLDRGVKGTTPTAGKCNASSCTISIDNCADAVPVSFPACYPLSGAARLPGGTGGMVLAKAADELLLGAPGDMLATDMLAGGCDGNASVAAGGAVETLVGGIGTNLIDRGVTTAALTIECTDSITGCSAGAAIKAGRGAFITGQDFVQTAGPRGGAAWAVTPIATASGGSVTLALADGTRVAFYDIQSFGAVAFP